MTTQYERYFYWLGKIASGDLKRACDTNSTKQYRSAEDPKKGYGKIGKYRMTEQLLASLGYYIFAKHDAGLSNSWKGTWTGRRKLNSVEDFLNNDSAQEYIVREAMRRYWRWIRFYQLDGLVGRQVKGLLLTESSLLAIAHFHGCEEILSLKPRKKPQIPSTLQRFNALPAFRPPMTSTPHAIIIRNNLLGI